MPARKIPVRNEEMENLKRQIEVLVGEKTNLETLVRNQQEEVKELRAKRTVSEEEWTRLQTISTTSAGFVEREKKMALWVRNNKQEEINQGRHVGLDIAEIMIMYAAASCPPPQKN